MALKKLPSIKVNKLMLSKLKEAAKISVEFEKLTGKQLNITSIVGEILTCEKLGLDLVKDDINQGFDAYDTYGKKVQIKTRRYKGVNSAMTGPLLDKNFKIPFDYAVLTLLNPDYSYNGHFILEASAIKKHFNRTPNWKDMDYLQKCHQ